MTVVLEEVSQLFGPPILDSESSSQIVRHGAWAERRLFETFQEFEESVQGVPPSRQESMIIEAIQELAAVRLHEERGFKYALPALTRLRFEARQHYSYDWTLDEEWSLDPPYGLSAPIQAAEILYEGFGPMAMHHELTKVFYVGTFKHGYSTRLDILYHFLPGEGDLLRMYGEESYPDRAFDESDYAELMASMDFEYPANLEADPIETSLEILRFLHMKIIYPAKYRELIDSSAAVKHIEELYTAMRDNLTDRLP